MKRQLNSIENKDNIKIPKLVVFGNSFRKKLKTDQALHALKEFVSTNKQRDVITEYVKCGGSAKELIGLLKQFNDHKDFSAANTVFSAFYSLIVKTIDDLPLIQKNVEEACDEVLCSYLAIMQTMLAATSSSTSHRKVILRLLSGMVALSDDLAKKILALFPISPKLLITLIDSRNSSSACKLRHCFIHYLLSFLRTESTVILCELLKKKGLLTSIVTGLMKDPPEIVVLVLNTFRTKIIENLKIPKTLKMHTFNTMVLRSIFKLYDYKIIKQSQDNNEDNEELSRLNETVRESAHSLLILLCASSKKGVLFREKHLTSGKNPNQLILTLIEDIDSPWKDELKCLLVTKILEVCPEFMKSIFSKLETYLSPSASEEWIKLITFVKKVIESQNVNIDSVNYLKIFNNSISSAFPSIIQKFLRDFTDDMIHPHPIIRYNIISLLVTILSKIATILEQSSQIFENDNNSIVILKELTEQFLNKNLLSSLHLVNAWNAGIDFVFKNNFDDFTNDNSLNYPNVNEYYLSLVDLLLLYKNLCPMCFNQLRMEENLNIINVDVSNLELLFKQALLIFHAYNLKPGQERFSFVIKQLIEYYICIKSCKNDILKDVFCAMGFFDQFDLQIVIWLNCMKNVAAKNSTIIAELFVDILNTLAKKNKKFLKDITILIEDEYNENLCFENTNLFETSENFFETNEELEQTERPSTSFSPIIPSFLYVLQSYEKSENISSANLKAIKSFTLSILVHSLHLQCNYRGLMKIVDKYKSIYIESSFFEYINFWNHAHFKTKLFKCPFANETPASNLCHAFINGNFHNEVLCDILNLDETEHILLWNTCIFYAVQLNNKQVLDEEKLEIIASTFNILCNALQPTNKMLCLQLLLTNPNFIGNFYLKLNVQRNVLTDILLKVIENFYKNSQIIPTIFSKSLSPYRLRFILCLLNKMNHQECVTFNFNGLTVENVMELIMLPPNIAVNLFENCLRLPISLLIDEKNKCFTEWVDLIVSLLKITAKNLNVSLENEILLLLISKVTDMLKLKIRTDILEDGIIFYLHCFPHHLNFIPEDLVNDLLVYHPTIDKLALYLLPHHPKYLLVLQDKIFQNIRKIDAGTLFEAVSQIESISNVESIFSILYDYYLSTFNNLLKVGCSLYAKNPVLLMNIFQKCLKKEDCSKLCEHVALEWGSMKLDENTCCFLKIVFEKANKAELYVQLLILKLNDVLASSENTNWLCVVVCAVAEKQENIKFSSYSESWKKFIELSLKTSLETSNSTLMHTLKIICDKSLTENEFDEINDIFQLLVSHSKFINVILDESNIKCELLELFLSLIIKNKSLMSCNHVPLLLGSYKATLSRSDQLLLQILQWYEESGIRFSDCRPYLWGSAAVIHHNIRTEISVSLKRQPQANQVLELLDINIVKNTIKYFPLNRSLQPGKCLHVVEDEIYDLSFILPLMSHLLAPESRLSVQKFTRSGALSLILVALSSDVPDIRIAAFHCLQRFHSHLSSYSREKEIQIWDHFLNALKNGISSSKQESGKNDNVPKLSCLTTVFLAHMALIISEPLDSLFVPLTNFLLAKPAFDINTVPNFLVLFYSSDLKYREHQKWILKILKYGMRTVLDWKISQKCFLFKLLQQYYNTSASHETVNILILDIIAKALHIQECKLLLITKCGFLSWFLHITRNMSDNQINMLPLMLNILKTLVNIKNSSGVLVITLLLLRKSIRNNINRTNVENLLQILSTLYCSCKDKHLLCESDVLLIIEFASPYFDFKYNKIYKNCLKYKSIVGIDECVENINNYVFKIVRQFVYNCSII